MQRATWRRVAGIAEAQLGLVTREQLDEAGVGEWLLAERLRSRSWQRLQRGVFCVTLGAPSVAQLELAAQLAAGAGAVLSHHTAAARLGLDVPRSSVVHVTVPVHRHPAPLPRVRIWRCRDVLPGDVWVRGAVRHTRLGRTVLDLAGVLEDGWLRAVVDSALRQSPSNRKWIDQSLRDQGAGRPGAERLRRVLDAQALDEPTDSALESLAMELGLATGRKPRLHHRVLAGSRLVAEVDLAWPEVRLCVELDGFAFHATRAAFERDRARDRALAALGYAVLRFTWRDVRQAPQRFIDELWSAHARQLERLRDAPAPAHLAPASP